MITLLIILLAIVGIGFMYGGFVALIVTIIAAIMVYLVGIYATGLAILLATIGSAIYKFKSK